MEPRKQDQRLVPKTYYYLDYKEFVDVVKWKMFKMQTNVHENLKTQSDNRGYVCPQCEKQFDPFAVLSLFDPTDQAFHCDQCETSLEQNDNAETMKNSQQVLTKLREQSQPIITLLKQTDNIVIPSSYIYKASMTGKHKHNKDDYELAIAQDTGAGQGDIIVDLQMDNEAARRAKMEEAEQKRQQNALPIWHQQSTISGTRLVPDASDKPDDTEDIEDEDAGATFEDIAPEIDADTEDYYAKYYENLSNGEPTSTSAYDAYEIGNNDSIAGTGEDEEEDFDEDDIPMVSVNGKMIPLNEVQEEDQRNMTTDEYKAYYEAWERWQNS
ncbi:hypothetical protein BDF20DRAFT_812433 [Mycotypha africana]|uniref:uncharacterized protein n=1 Tax=Mycotypha africana TaxID=64632 RepID=UPI002300AC6D|nr:uncharacterized protein BDF20DRAFT_812433 [Mycotypha africana]KAI8991546.1 hypothetical protein BDF20DRAFT_812433 [Mycotypha africana]